MSSPWMDGVWRAAFVASAVAMTSAIACGGTESVTAGFAGPGGDTGNPFAGASSFGGGPAGGFGAFGAFGGSGADVGSGGSVPGGTTSFGGTTNLGGARASGGEMNPGGSTSVLDAGAVADAASGADGSTSGCVAGSYRCVGNQLQQCGSSGFQLTALCAAGQCDAQLGRCLPSTCGNGRLDPGEDCENGNLRGSTCSSATMGTLPSGILRCSPQCVFDTSGCHTNGGVGGATGAGGTTGTGGRTGTGGGP